MSPSFAIIFAIYAEWRGESGGKGRILAMQKSVFCEDCEARLRAMADLDLGKRPPLPLHQVTVPRTSGAKREAGVMPALPPQL